MSDIEDILGYAFENSRLLHDALTHPSRFRHSHKVHRTFERLEFLGDRVLGLCIATLLFEHLKGEDEKDFATRLAYSASTASLIKLANRTGLIKYFGLTEEEKQSGASSIADMVEATLAAIYLDSNFETTLGVVQRLFGKELYTQHTKDKDSKSALQEYSQKFGFGLPVYTVVESHGLQHNLSFTVEVQVNGTVGRGEGKNKREAEQNAAKALLARVAK